LINRPQFVVTVGAPSQDLQKKIDLRKGRQTEFGHKRKGTGNTLRQQISANIRKYPRLSALSALPASIRAIRVNPRYPRYLSCFFERCVS
jgi:hypothetical protein